MVVHGNRGKCAQPCRLPYELLKDSQVIDKGHLLSPKDLCSLDLLPTLVNLGITCFKIEGRLKNPEYVSTVTRIYRKYIDLAQSDKPYIVDEKDRKYLLQVFNRGGFSKGYLDPKPNQEFIYKEKPNNMGIFIGTVYNFNPHKGYITLKLQDDISIGDTVSLERETGSYTISELMIDNKNVPAAKKGNIVKIGRIKGCISSNDKIYKMSSKALCDLANEYVNSEKIKQKINCKIILHKDEPVSMQIYTNNSELTNIYNNINFTITSDLLPVESLNSPITTERVIHQIDKLGGTPFEFENIDVDLDNNLYVPSISKLNQLRRDCISKLEETLLDKIHRKYNADLNHINAGGYSINKDNSNQPKRISVLLNILSNDYSYSILKNIDRIYIPLKYFFMPEFDSKIAEITKLADTYIYMPPILKDSVIKKILQNLDRVISTNSIHGFVISNISHFHFLEKYLKDYEIISNYTMNVYNNYSVAELEEMHVSCVTLSPELDASTLNSFECNVQTEAIVYGNLPVMTTNYCLLSNSNFCLEKCKSNCNSSNHKYYLKDRLKMNFRIIPDSFLKATTIFNSKTTSVCANDINVNFARLDFIDESIEDICMIVEKYRNGRILEGKDFTNGNFNRIV